MGTSDDGTPRPPKRFEDVASGEAVSRTAAHESGHILPAWLSWSIASVDGTVFIAGETEGVVRVLRTVKRPYTAVQLWEALVISAGGMAGEVVTHVTFKTKNCRHDLQGMRTQTELIERHFGAGIRPPWPEPGDHKAPPFERFYADGLPDGWGDLMRSAYRRARDIILRHRPAFERLRVALLAKMELSTAEIADAIGIPKA